MKFSEENIKKIVDIFISEFNSTIPNNLKDKIKKNK
jgi:hypothetical protein